MKRILCPTDFSDTAQNAIAYAAKLAHALHSDMTLLHVQSMFDFTPADIIYGKQPIVESIQERLEAQSLEITKVFKVACYAEVESTFRKLSAVIRDKAKNYDLIVMGTDGPDDLYQLFGGSNTYNAIVKSEISVLLIPNGYTYSAIKRMIFGYDYLGERDLPLEHLIPFVKTTDCELTVLQVMEEAYSKEAETELQELQFLIRQRHHEIPYKFDTIRSANVAKGINDYLIRKQPDVLALCSIHRNLIQDIFHKSIVKNISAVSGIPVLVFHKKL